MKETAYQLNIFVELNPVDSLLHDSFCIYFSNNYLCIDCVKIVLLLKGSYFYNSK